MENQQFTQIIQAINGLEERLERKMDEKLSSLEERMDEKLSCLEEKMDEKLIGLEKRMDRKMDSLEERINDGIEQKVDSLESKMIATFNLRIAEVKGELSGLREEVRSNNAQFCHLLGNISKRVHDIEEKIA